MKIIKSSRIKYISEGNELPKGGILLVRRWSITLACRGVVWYCQQIRQLWMNMTSGQPGRYNRAIGSKSKLVLCNNIPNLYQICRIGFEKHQKLISKYWIINIIYNISANIDLNWYYQVIGNHVDFVPYAYQKTQHRYTRNTTLCGIDISVSQNHPARDINILFCWDFV